MRFTVCWEVLLVVFILVCFSGGGHFVFAQGSPSVLRVGPGMQYSKPSLAAQFARDGDTIEILAATYRGDVAVWRQNNLTIRGIYGRARLEANGKHAQGKAIWVIKGNNTRIENIEFSGATVPDGNGAGIRLEGANLYITNCYFHDNENGILTGSNANSDITIERSEFARNGAGDGRTHNMYIGRVNRLTVKYCYSHHAKVGHNLKSRARENFIMYNRIMDEREGSSSYAVDIPNGGLCYLIGNVIQQGPNSENYHIISYGAEGLSFKKNALYIVNNTIVNDRDNGVFIRINAQTQNATVFNNIFCGQGKTVSGRANAKSNLTISPKSFLGFSLTSSGFVNAYEFDYRLLEDSPAVDSGSDPGIGHHFDLTPKAEYVHLANARKRIIYKAIDIGAYEYLPGN